jgi:hypothetical protein
MGNQYMCIKSDAGNGLIEGKLVTPYYENANEIIINGARPDADHHIKKDGEYFKNHLAKAGN